MNTLKYFIQQSSFIGHIHSWNSRTSEFSLKLRTGQEIQIIVKPETFFSVLTNLDNVSLDEFDKQEEDIETKCSEYLRENTLVSVECTLQQYEGKTSITADVIHILINQNENLLFEHSDWWINQISRMADEWLDDLFGDNRNYTQEDFASLYRTNLNTYGLETDDTIQETATLSRLIYGLSSAYHLTGCERYLNAAKAGVEYQRNSFKLLTSDGEHCFWAYGRRRQKYGTEFKLLSENGDDFGTIPLYEQIYAIAGLAQYYRITVDPKALEDIRQSVNTFEKYYRDKTQGGYFSHLDYASQTPTADRLGDNKARKNWNSIGDHIPAYLINILLSLNPLPSDLAPEFNDFVKICQMIFDDCINNILQYFPDENNRYVNERFYQDWEPDHDWRWQQNRAIVGHNLKIAWNLTRAANYYKEIGNSNKVKDCLDLAVQLANNMAEFAVDPIRGGCFDAVEREPTNNMPLEMVWKSTKDFWQQEQCILAYLILYAEKDKADYLDLARETLAFWNINFLDRKNRGIFFRVNDIGLPVFQNYDNKAGHAIAGYHSFELNFLTHLYQRSAAFTNKENEEEQKFCLYFSPHESIRQTNLNVKPDYLPNSLKITSIVIDGIDQSSFDSNNFQIPIIPSCKQVKVEYQIQKLIPSIEDQKGKIGVLIEKHFDEAEYIKFNDFFPKNGYEVEYFTDLWQAESVVYTGNDYHETRIACTVTKDIRDVEANYQDYAGFILIGGYAMDRLRYETNPSANQENNSPAVQFLQTVNKHKYIGTICHSLWLLTVNKEFLKNRKVTCAHNIIYDVQNAGGEVIYNDNNIGTIDVNLDTRTKLVTGKHPGVVNKFCDKFLEAIESETLGD
uniref:N-acylglucosamine 2-epimerase n=1 Tax=Derbesia sp. WEST4838 TaxID=1847751 RepID=A0A1C9JBK6_9CHLO|nr:hypothetical protein [Derbesia sp. WEST4838]AOP19221.1 hypothetical protein [Derbesia sp. WEST4838]